MRTRTISAASDGPRIAQTLRCGQPDLESSLEFSQPDSALQKQPEIDLGMALDFFRRHQQSDMDEGEISYRPVSFEALGARIRKKSGLF